MTWAGSCRIEMLNVGWMTAAAGLWRQGEEEPERPVRVPVPAYLVETETERILIDTGLHPAAAADAETRLPAWGACLLRAGAGGVPRDYADATPNLTLLDGDHDLLGDGSIELLSTPGHTPGQPSVRIGDLVLGADVAHFASVLDDHRFPAFGDDRDEQGRSAERLRKLRDEGLTVQPGHDPDVLRPSPLTPTG